MSATEPEARAELIFSSLLASGTHWNSTSMPVWSSRAVITAPCGSGVAGVWKTDIQDSEPSLPPAAVGAGTPAGGQGQGPGGGERTAGQEGASREHAVAFRGPRVGGAGEMRRFSGAAGGAASMRRTERGEPEVR